MIRVSLRNMTGEPLDFFDCNEDEAANVIVAKLASGNWLLAAGDSITLEDAE